jgi:hypothetical protein
LKFSELGIKITSLAIAMCITHYIIAMWGQIFQKLINCHIKYA